MPDAPGLEELLAASKPAEYLRAARTLGAGTYPGLRSLRIGLLGSCTYMEIGRASCRERV